MNLSLRKPILNSHLKLGPKSRLTRNLAPISDAPPPDLLLALRQAGRSKRGGGSPESPLIIARAMGTTAGAAQDGGSLDARIAAREARAKEAP